MSSERKILCVLFLFWNCFAYVNAQETISSGGGNAIGSGGSLSYRFGQLAYNTYSGATGSVAQGVGQPYEISNAPFTQDILLTPGWNIFSFAVEPGNMNMITILKPLITAGTLVKVQDEKGNAIDQLLPPIGWIDNIHNFNPGEGYKIRTSISTSLDINNPAGKGDYVFGEPASISPSHFKPSFPGNVLEHMNIYLTNSTPGAAALKTGDEIGVLDGALCVGTAVVDYPTLKYIMLKASLDDLETSTKDGFIEGHRFEVRLWDNSSGTELKAQKFEIVKGYRNLFEKSGTSVLSASFDMIPGNVLGDAYPNPSTGTTTFTFHLADECMVRFEILNLMGELVKVLIDRNMPGGSHTVQWDNLSAEGSKAKAGIYFYRIRLKDFMQTKSLVIH